MQGEPFTIRITVSDEVPEGIRLLDRMNWTGVGVVTPREKWPAARHYPELARTGAYILVGYKEGFGVGQREPCFRRYASWTHRSG